MKLKELLTERLSPIVYHATELKNLSLILSRNLMVASPLFVRDDESRDNKVSYFFISTARSRTSPFIQTLLSSGKTVGVLTLNGEKLNNTYKGKSVNYFLNRKNNELEDRLFTDEQFIRNISEYIEQISILVVGNISKTLLDVKKMCKEKNIPVYFYNNKNDLTTNNKAKSINIDNASLEQEKEDQSKNNIKFPKNLDALIYFYENDNPKTISPEYEEYVKDLTIDQYKQSWISTLKKELNLYYRNEKIIGFFKDILKKERVYTLDELVDKISDKWKAKLRKIAA